MIGIRISILSYLSNEPQPGLVACDFLDAHGQRWRFVEKTAVVSAEDLDAAMSYPRPGVIACEIVAQRPDAEGRTLVLIDTERPWGVQSTEGLTRFEVLPSSLIEFV